MTTAKAYGHEVTFRRRVAPAHGSVLGEPEATIEEKTIHRKGSQAVAIRAARLTTGFVELVRVEPLTEEAWRNVYGYEGRT